MAALPPAAIVQALAPIVGRVGAAGVAGNLMQESSDNPASAGGGLAQWQGPRYSGLVRYAQSRGLAPTSAQAALGYLAQDLKGPYSGLAAQLRGAQSPAHAADLFSQIYERPGVPMLGNRERYAQEALRGGGAPGSSGGGLSALPPSRKASGGTQGTPVTETTTGLDQKAFQAAQRRYIAGSFLKAQGSSSNPYADKGSSVGANPLLASGALTTTAPNPADYQKTTTRTYQAAHNALQALAGGTSLSVHPAAVGKAGRDVNPLQHFTLGRTDMGVDANARAGTPILAPNTAKVVGMMPNWYQGQPYVAVQLLAGPNKGRVMYVAEQITSLPKQGQIIARGQPIAVYANRGTGIEIGWANPRNPLQTEAQATGQLGTGDHSNAPAGQQFRNYLNGL